MDGGGILTYLRGELAGAASSFARRYRGAHQQAGMRRLAASGLLAHLAENGLDGLAERLRDEQHDLSQENVDRVLGNLALAYLFRDLKPRLEQRMAEARALGIGPFAPPPAWMSGPARLNWLREQSCLTLNAVLQGWAPALAASTAPACPFARAARGAKALFAGSALYQRADHDLLSIATTGSNTALHVCFSLVEAAGHLGLRLPAEEWRGVLWRSRKEITALASGSLGMIVTYLTASHLHPHGDTATSPTHREDCAFRLKGEGETLRLTLEHTQVTPFSTGHDKVYTGCPAFHVTGLIETYLTWVLDVAVAQGLHGVEEAPRAATPRPSRPIPAVPSLPAWHPAAPVRL
ncbi:MAG TPA: hypothetical protein VED40_03345 [Azospirillaceae bacterium]|nr:hypothetical protein [Azospirillaceae bacterium]